MSGGDDEEEEEEEVEEGDEEEEVEEEEPSTTVATRKVPAKVRERQRQLNNNLPPWISSHKSRHHAKVHEEAPVSEEEFNKVSCLFVVCLFKLLIHMYVLFLHLMFTCFYVMICCLFFLNGFR